jgi:hypothetical protein
MKRWEGGAAPSLRKAGLQNEGFMVDVLGRVRILKYTTKCIDSEK